MPPKSSFTSSFSASDVDNEVVCPLRNHDGSNCRKRCLGVSLSNLWKHGRARFVVKLILTLNLFHRRSATGQCKSISGGHIQSTTSLSFPRPRKAFSLWSTPHPLRDRNLHNLHNLHSRLWIQVRQRPWHLGGSLLTIIVYGHDREVYAGSQSSPAPPRSLEDQYPAAATAAVALAQLHNHRPDSDWDSEAVSILSFNQK